MSKTTVVNIRMEPCDEYIGRKKVGMHFGNPFTHLDGIPNTVKVGSREEAVSNCRKWLKGEEFIDLQPERRKWILENLPRLKGKKLGCYCWPSKCHGELYVEMLEPAEEVQDLF